jgi:Rrf2 family protein
MIEGWTFAMLSLNRKTDYALVALADMADRPLEWASAREMAERGDVPAALLMNVLKTLHGAGILRSSRGMRGGYQIATDLERLSLFDLVRILERTDRSADANGGEPACCGRYKISRAGNGQRHGQGHGPVHAFHHKLRHFLRSVPLSDLVLPGRRIDVPVELVSMNRKEKGAKDNNAKDKTNPIPHKLSAALVTANT